MPSRNDSALLPQRVVQPRSSLLFAKAGQLAARDNRSGLRESTDEVVRFVQYPQHAGRHRAGVPGRSRRRGLGGPALPGGGGGHRAAVSRRGRAGVGAGGLAGDQRRRPPDAVRRSSTASRPCSTSALGIVLASRYGALGMAEAALIGVVVMEGMLMLPLVYRQLGDSVPRPGCSARCESWACPRSSRAASPGWSGGAAARCTPSRTRTSGSSGSSVSSWRAPRSMVVFYVFLLVSLAGRAAAAAPGPRPGLVGPARGPAALVSCAVTGLSAVAADRVGSAAMPRCRRRIRIS